MTLRRPIALLVHSLLLSACASHPKVPEVSPPIAHLDASYDWHVLLAAPFGSLLKDIPLPRNEVLVFDAETPQAPGECYTLDSAPPRFLSQVPAELTLCFRHDRLARIEATVMLPVADAPRILADACALWQRNAAATVAQLAATTAPQPATDAGAGACRGRDGEVDFDGRLEQEADLDADGAFLPYTITLDAYDPS